MKIFGIRILPTNEWSAGALFTWLLFAIVWITPGYVLARIVIYFDPPTARMAQPCAVGCKCGCKCVPGRPGEMCGACRPKPWRGGVKR